MTDHPRGTTLFAGAVLLAGAVTLAACGGSAHPRTETRGSGSSPNGGGVATSYVKADPSAGPVSPITSPGGPFLLDKFGRVVLMHGVDLVYKVPPYEVEVSGSGPNVLTVPEVKRMAALGFDVVRLGIIWKGLEPGTGSIDDPSVCTPGKPTASDTAEFDASTFDAYLKRLDATIALLSKYGIYSLLDMHQDVYSDVFAGEGAPHWAVCTDGLKPAPRYDIPNWSDNLTGPGVMEAYENFWENDVVGNLQGQFEYVWSRVAAHYRDNPWVIGYDPFNEPYGTGLSSGNTTVFDGQLQCFFMGRSDPGTTQEGKPLSCPADDPSVGLIPLLESADPTHLVFYDTDYSVDSGPHNNIGPMAEPNLVLNFHDYCFLHVPNGPEPPDYGSICGRFENLVFNERSSERSKDSTAQQPGGPAWFLTEFGATTDTADLGRVTSDANSHLVSWIYWQWLHYDDPTGSHTSGLWPPTAPTASMLDVLSQTYAQAVAGTPTAMTFDTTTAKFVLTYTADDSISQPTVVFVPLSVHYPHGYCTTVTGGHVTSPRGAQHVDIVNDSGAKTVSVSITAGACG